MSGPGRPDITNVLKKPPSNPGRLEDEYEVGRVLGKGAYGVVKEAIHRPTNSVWAIKSISKAKLVSESDIQDVQREVAIMNHVVGHSNIVSLKDTYEDLSSVHIVMDLCSGGELFDAIVEAGSYSEATAAEVFRKMVGMIQHCHDLGVMHRDLKPENFLLTCKDPNVSDLKATDFGLSVFFHPEQRFSEMVGSPFYIAPEVLDRDYTYHADYWSLGVILYILLSGLPPFWGESEEQIFDMIRRGKVNFKLDPWPTISDSAKDLVRQLLSSDPMTRPRAQQILDHPWLTSQAAEGQQPIDSVVLHRLKSFAAMGKLKKAALMVVATCLSPEEI